MAGPARTHVELPELSNEERTRMKSLEHELRCLVCQNQTLADSNAELAGDLRNQVHRLVAEGRSNQDIKDYLVARYGDFVLYRPPMQSNTALLWGGPFGLLAIGGVAWFMIQRRQRLAGVQVRTDPDDEATADSRKRARSLLD